MNYEVEIKNLRQIHSDGVINRAKSEERLKALNTKREDVLKRCADKNVKPEEIPTKMAESENKLIELINQAKSLFAPQEQATNTSSNPAAPF